MYSESDGMNMTEVFAVLMYAFGEGQFAPLLSLGATWTKNLLYTMFKFCAYTTKSMSKVIHEKFNFFLNFSGVSKGSIIV